MTIKFALAGDRVLFEKDGATIFDTDKFPVAFFPATERIEIAAQTITFPDLVKGDAYAFARGLIGGSLNVGCASYITIGPQEWGPDDPEGLPITNELADIVLGTVPAGTDLALIQVRLNRTSAPSQIKGTTIPVLPEEGEFVNCPGGCLLVEYLPPLARMIEIRLGETDEEEGTTEVILRRRQSVVTTNYSFWRAGNDPDNTGWTHGGAAGASGHPVYHLQSLGPVFDPSGESLKRTNVSSRCSLTDTSNFGSTYSADIVITPGKSNIEPEGGEFEGAVGLQYMGSHFHSQTGSAGSHTFAGVPIGPPSPNRTIIVVAKFAASAQASARDITSVSLGGDAMTQRVYRDLDINSGVGGTPWSSYCAGIYVLNVPEGVSADIVVANNGTGGRRHYEIDVYAVYGLEATTTHATRSANNVTPSSNLTLATLDGGIAIAGTMTQVTGSTDDQGRIYGMSTAGYNFHIDSSAPVLRTSRGFAFQITTGSTLTVDAEWAHSFVAASFR